VAVVCGARRIGWAELDERINRVASALVSLGIRKGDKVALLAPNGVEAIEVLFGAMRAGGVAVPLPLMAHPDHLAQLVADSDAKVLFTAAPLTTTRAPRVIALPPDPDGGYEELTTATSSTARAPRGSPRASCTRTARARCSRSG
jgi:acyl-CoA synthetase (AMP-forming)/AMP-acid ligase II